MEKPLPTYLRRPQSIYNFILPRFCIALGVLNMASKFQLFLARKFHTKMNFPSREASWLSWRNLVKIIAMELDIKYNLTSFQSLPKTIYNIASIQSIAKNTSKQGIFSLFNKESPATSLISLEFARPTHHPSRKFKILGQLIFPTIPNSGTAPVNSWPCDIIGIL